jgi:hypothetical protein
VPLFLKRQCDRTLAAGRDEAAGAAEAEPARGRLTAAVSVVDLAACLRTVQAWIGAARDVSDAAAAPVPGVGDLASEAASAAAAAEIAAVRGLCVDEGGLSFVTAV